MRSVPSLAELSTWAASFVKMAVVASSVRPRKTIAGPPRGSHTRTVRSLPPGADAVSVRERLPALAHASHVLTVGAELGVPDVLGYAAHRDLAAGSQVADR